MSTDRSRWVIIYPIYMNSKKTLAEGRRLAISQSCENPTASEIGDCCAFLNLAFCIEPEKAYSRDGTGQRGRVRVQLKKVDGSPVNAEIPSRRVLMLKVADLMSKHRSRIKKGEAGASTTNTGGGKSGKGGRKKK
ncbi:hypothetical protein KP509_21G083300 [Ceratopteris richardii]|uniref:Signal recognition particle 19 kDa protein n=1 Tax=Ceratopteris richardii TaxID=49495 RepID=A0A8T2SFQ3_CERRI|nr:hypothetical protein KP509_21G083300 [Ceratopteris richardii]